MTSIGDMGIHSSSFSDLKLSEIDLLEAYLEVCANLDIVREHDPFWMVLGVRLNIKPRNVETDRG